MTKEELIQFEEEIKELYLAAKIYAPVHLCGGCEEALIEIFKGIKSCDWVCSTHRAHYHALLHGVDREWLKNEILAGRSIGIHNKERNFISSAIVGGILPIALGIAMGIKRKGENRKVWVFVGDMAAETGIFEECKGYATGHNLPISFVIEDNHLSINTPTDTVWGFNRYRLDAGIILTVSAWEKGEVLRYCYERTFPHHGVGKFVTF